MRGWLRFGLRPRRRRALLTFAGKPVLAVPNGRRLEKALGQLTFMVSIDSYINETTRFADVILPPASALTEEHADFLVADMAVRDGIHWTRPVVERGADERRDWEIILAIAERMGGGITGQPRVDTALRALRLSILNGVPIELKPQGLRLGTEPVTTRSEVPPPPLWL